MPRPSVLLDGRRPGDEALRVPALLQRESRACGVGRATAGTDSRRGSPREPRVVPLATALSRPLSHANRCMSLDAAPGSSWEASMIDAARRCSCEVKSRRVAHDLGSAMNTPALHEERPGILAWAVRGAVVWHERGLHPPESVVAATQGYQVDSDPLAAFLAEGCELEPAAEVGAKELYDHYRQWALGHGLNDKERMGAAAFGR